MAAIQVLVVDDSALMRRIITDILQQDPAIRVIGTAKNGAEALQVIPHIQPDVITLDIEMPIMDGMQALPQILERYSTPVIMLSSLTTQGAEHTIHALEMGAFDFIAKPSGSISLNLSVVGHEMIEKVKAAARYKKRMIPIKPGSPTLIPPLKPGNSEPQELNSHRIDMKRDRNQPRTEDLRDIHTLVAIGTSTGGPRALQEVLPKLPSHLKAAIVIVQHMPPGFTKSLAVRLDSLCQIKVEEAQNGQILEEGHAYIAPGDFHMEVKESGGQYRIHVHQEAAVGGHRPAVDVLFHSVSKLEHLQLQAVILTGMGADGSKGMLEIKQRGAKTIAESEESCVVFGMPKAAIQKGCVDKVVPIQQVAEEIVKNLQERPI